MRKHLQYFLSAALLFPYLISGQTIDHYFTLSNVKSRPMAMGSAFTSIEDDLVAFGFNPAAYFLSNKSPSKRLSLFLNPIAPFVGAFNHNELFKDENVKFNDVLLSLSLLVKSVSVRLDRIQIGVLLGEQSLSVPGSLRQTRFFGLSGYRENHSHSIIARLKLADRVSVGATANLMFGSQTANPGERFSEVGFSYGVLLKPEKGLNVGVSFVNLPDSLNSQRMSLERFVDESVNIGVSYELFTKTLLSMDVRNLGEEASDVIREFHFGVEQVLVSQLALRAGYFKKNSDEHVFSCGVGILNGDRLFKRGESDSQRDFYLNYGFVYEKSGVLNNRWHFLTLMIRI